MIDLKKAILLTALIAIVVFAIAADKPTRPFNIRVEGEKQPGAIECFVKDEPTGELLPFDISESGKGRVRIPVNATTFTVNYGGVASRRIDIPRKKTPHTIVVKIEDAPLGAVPQLVGAESDRYKITVVVVDDRP